MTDKKNKILILLDGTEDLENSLNIATDTNILNCDQIVLFFILNPFNPITKGQETEVLYNDFVHDNGRRLASLYIEKLENIILSKNLDIEVSHNVVNSYENIIRRLALGDIDITVCSVKFSNKLDYIFNKSKNINYLVNITKNILIIPYGFNYQSKYKNNFLIPYSDFSVNEETHFNRKLNSFNIDKITLIYESKSKVSVENFIEESREKKINLESLEIDSVFIENLSSLSDEFNLIFSRKLKKKFNFWENFNKYSNYSLFSKKMPLFFHK